MSQPQTCAKCMCQSFTFKQGISKKNGKPWKGWKCDNKECGDMVFESSYPAKKPGYGYTPKPASAPLSNGGTLQDLTDLVSEIDNKIDLLLKKAGIGPDELLKLAKDEDTPF